ncbi:MAG: nucleoid-associated protein [Prevotella sp.]|nr:nucleoid-associated protein [Prevotella sp.]
MIKVNRIEAATIQIVGNKTRGEGLSSAYTLADVSDCNDFLVQLIEKSFPMDDLKCFTYIESLELNPVYQFVSKIFDDREEFLKQSVNIATFLYDQSVHPNIRSGELYVLLMQCEYKRNTLEAIAILKSEKKDPFLATDNDGRDITVRTIYGTGLKGLDKGCLILNTDRENGYLVGTIDNTNNGSDAQYWTESFLHVTNCEDDYHQTVRLMDMCKGFVKQQSELEGAIMAKKAADIFASGETLPVESLADMICQDEKQKEEFAAFRQSFEEEHGCFSEEVNVVKKAAIRKPVTKLTALKLGSDFEVKVLNPEAKIEGGVDKKSGKKYYTLYYEG